MNLQKFEQERLDEGRKNVLEKFKDMVGRYMSPHDMEIYFKLKKENEREQKATETY